MTWILYMVIGLFFGWIFYVPQDCVYVDGTTFWGFIGTVVCWPLIALGLIILLVVWGGDEAIKKVRKSFKGM